MGEQAAPAEGVEGHHALEAGMLPRLHPTRADPREVARALGQIGVRHMDPRPDPPAPWGIAPRHAGLGLERREHSLERFVVERLRCESSLPALDVHQLDPHTCLQLRRWMIFPTWVMLIPNSAASSVCVNWPDAAMRRKPSTFSSLRTAVPHSSPLWERLTPLSFQLRLLRALFERSRSAWSPSWPSGGGPRKARRTRSCTQCVRRRDSPTWVRQMLMYPWDARPALRILPWAFRPSPASDPS